MAREGYYKDYCSDKTTIMIYSLDKLRLNRIMIREGFNNMAEVINFVLTGNHAQENKK